MKQYFWQVIVLAENLKASPASSRIAIDLKNMFKSILSVSFPPEVNINFCIHTDFSLRSLFETERIGSEMGIPDKPALLAFRLIHSSENLNEINKDTIIDIGNSGLKLTLLKVQENVSMSSHNTVSSVLKICNTGVSFRKSIVFTFDHGNAFGIFRSRPVPQKFLENTKLAEYLERKHTRFQAFDFSDRSIHPSPFKSGQQLNNLHSDELSPYFTMDELSSVIEESSFPEGKVDLLIMLNCFMMSMDTLFALKDTVRYLVAPQTAICFYGYHYASILTLLSNEFDTIEAESLARHAVSSIAESPEYKKNKRYLDKLALFGADISVYNSQRIWETENRLFEKIRNLPRQKLLEVRKIRQNIWSLTFTASLTLDLLLIDTIGWFEACKPVLNDSEYESDIESLKDSIYQMMGGVNQRSYRGKFLPKMIKMPVNGTSNYMPFRASDLEFNCFKWFYEKDPTNYAKQGKLWEMIKTLFPRSYSIGVGGCFLSDAFKVIWYTIS